MNEVWAYLVFYSGHNLLALALLFFIVALNVKAEHPVQNLHLDFLNKFDSVAIQENSGN